MVGVPGKSKGCSTCRRRKKGCDQERPVCRQCTTSGYVCGGYERDRIFILHPASRAVEKAIFLPHPRVRSGDINQSLQRTAVRTQCKSLFWNLYMPYGHCICTDDFILRCGHIMNWALMVQELPSNETSLENAFTALSVSRVGKEYKDPRLIRESSMFYGRALKDMQLALYDSNRLMSDEVLTATMILTLYELLDAPNLYSDTWSSHAQGAARLIELRGPHRHQKRQAHQVFLGSRIPTIYGAILQRKATYLATPEWLSIPWEGNPRTYLDRLIDVLTALPDVLAQIDVWKVTHRITVTQGQQRDLLKQLQHIQDRIIVWQRGLRPVSLSWKREHVVADGDIYPFDYELCFSDHLFVNANIIAWTGSLVVAEAYEKLQQMLDNYENKSFDSSHRNLVMGTAFNALDNATKICQSIPYCLQPEMGALGPSIITVPANLAFRYFRQRGNTPVTLWLGRVFRNMRNRGLHLNRMILGDDPIFVNDLHDATPTEPDTNSSPMTKYESSSEESSDTGSQSPQLSDTTSNHETNFVYENPSKYYIDTSNDRNIL